MQHKYMIWSNLLNLHNCNLLFRFIIYSDNIRLFLLEQKQEYLKCLNMLLSDKLKESLG